MRICSTEFWTRIWLKSCKKNVIIWCFLLEFPPVIYPYSAIYFYSRIYYCFEQVNVNWIVIKDTLKAFDDLETSGKSVWSIVFWYVKVCIFWRCVQYTMHWDKTQILKKFPSEKTNGSKTCPLLPFTSSNLS